MHPDSLTREAKKYSWERRRNRPACIRAAHLSLFFLRPVPGTDDAISIGFP